MDTDRPAWSANSNNALTGSLSQTCVRHVDMNGICPCDKHPYNLDETYACLRLSSVHSDSIFPLDSRTPNSTLVVSSPVNHIPTAVPIVFIVVVYSLMWLFLQTGAHSPLQSKEQKIKAYFKTKQNKTENPPGQRHEGGEQNHCCKDIKPSIDPEERCVAR